MNPAVKRRTGFHACLSSINVIFLLLFFYPSSLFSAVSSPVAVDEQDDADFSRITAYFASVPEYKCPCSELEVPNRVPVVGLFLSEEDDRELDTKFGIHKKKKIDIEAQYRKTALAAEKMVEASMTYYRAKDQGYTDLKVAEFNYNYELYVWLWNLRDLVSKEKELREISTSYYALWSKAFGRLELEFQQKVLKQFAERAACLQKERRKVFDKLQKARMELWNNTRSQALDAFDTAGLILKSNNLEEAYARLVAEQSSLRTIYSNLLTVFDQSLRNRDLFDELVKAYKKQPFPIETDPIPATDRDSYIRLQILRARAQKALLALHMQDIKIEAAYTGQLSMTAGYRAGMENISNSARQAIDNLWTAGTLTMRGEFENMGGQVMAFALIGYSYRFLGSSFSVLVSTPMQDAFTDTVWKEGLGFEVKNSMEKALALYEQQRRELDIRIKLVETIRDKTTVEDGQAFISDIKKGGGFAGGKSIAGRAPMTTRGMLEDPDFIDESDGGLAWIFEIICRSPSEHAALLLNGARYEMAGRLRTGYARIAANRGMSADNPDQTVNRAVIQELTDPGSKTPSDFHEYIIANTDQFLNAFPVVSGIKAAYEAMPKFKNMLQFLVGNIPDQDSYLKSYVDLQEKYDLVLGGLRNVDFDFNAFPVKHWNLYLIHQHLLNKSFEYAQAYRIYRTASWERTKLIQYIEDSNNRQKGFSSKAKGLLAAFEISQREEYTDIEASAAFLKLLYYTFTIDYLKAAQQTIVLQVKENQRREAFKEPGKVDLSGIAKKFEGQAMLQDVIGIYEELYYKAVEDVISGAVTTCMANYFTGTLAGKFGLAPFINAADSEAADKIWGTFNPWAGKFSMGGVWEVLQSGAIDSVNGAVAQTLASKQNLFTEQEIEKVAGFVVSAVSETLSQSLTHVAQEGAVKWYSTEAEYNRRILEAKKTVEAARRTDDADSLLADRLSQAADSEILDDAQDALEEITDNSDGSSQERDRARAYRALALEELEEAAAEHRRTEREIEPLVELPLAEIIKAKARSRLRNGESSPDEVAKLHALSDFKKLLKVGVPSVDDLERLTSNNDPLHLRQYILTGALGIKDIREGLGKARSSAKKKGEKETEKRIRKIAEDIDRVRIDRVKNLLDEFFTSKRPDLADLVMSVIQVGAAEGNPEHQGIFGDIDFTIFTRDGVDGKKLQEIKDSLQDFFKLKGYPLATQENNGNSPLDTEAFVQHWSPFDTAAADYGDAIANIAANMADPTRFPSWGGGIWANNNAAYSGKKLWGSRPDSPERPDFVPLKKHRANDIAIDMAKFMGFIIDPSYHESSLNQITDLNDKKKHLAKGLSKAKAALRMFDALLVSDDAGNRAYNTRLDRREESGENASYHMQIYRDLKRLHDDGSMKILTSDDLDLVRKLALMKMKGDNPEVWDVLGDKEVDVNEAQRIIDHIRTLVPRVIALTAENQHRELERVAREGSENERKVAAIDLYRQASTLLKTAKDTPFGVLTSLMIPKAQYNRESGEFEVLSLADHEAKIRDAIKRNAAIIEDIRIRSELDEAVRNRPGGDILGNETRARIKKIIDSMPTAGSVNLEEENTNIGWFQDVQRKVRIIRAGMGYE